MKILLLVKILTIISLLSTSGIQYFYTCLTTTENTQSSEDILQENLSDMINPRAFFKKYEKPKKTQNFLKQDNEMPEVLTYHIFQNKTLHSTTVDGRKTLRVKKLEALCDVQSLYDLEDDVLEIAIGYLSVNKSTTTQAMKEELVSQKTGFENFNLEQPVLVTEFSDEEQIKSEQVIQNRFYMAKVSVKTGEILEFLIEDQFEEDKEMNLLTEQFCKEIIPNLIKKDIENGSIEEDNFGHKKINHSVKQQDDYLHISSSQNNEDYVHYHSRSTKMLTHNYQKNAKLHKDTGVVHSSATGYNYGTKEEGEEEEDENQILGHFVGSMHRNFELVDTSLTARNMQKVSEKLLEFRNTGSFVQSILYSKFKGGTVLNPKQEDSKPEQIPFYKDYPVEKISQEEAQQKSEDFIHQQQNVERYSDSDEFEQQQTKLKSGNILFDQENTILKRRFLHHIVEVSADFQITQTSVIFNMGLYVDGHLITTIINEEWGFCPQIHENFEGKKEFKKSKSMTILKDIYPLADGVFLNFSLVGDIDYGFKIDAYELENGCGAAIGPYVSIELQGTADASFLELYEVGFYVEGKFLDTNLALSTLPNDTGKQQIIKLDLNINPFEISFGINTQIQNPINEIISQQQKNKKNIDNNNKEEVNEQKRKLNWVSSISNAVSNGVSQAFGNTTEFVQKQASTVYQTTKNVGSDVYHGKIINAVYDWDKGTYNFGKNVIINDYQMTKTGTYVATKVLNHHIQIYGYKSTPFTQNLACESVPL